MLLAALVVLVGGLMLALRSSDGLLSTLLQRESNDARDAAEAGITRIIGELNRPRNRGLLVKAGSAEDPDGYLWTSTDAEADPNHFRNPCLPAADSSNPDLATNPNIGANSTGTPYNTVYLNDAGAVTDKSTATRAYRLLWVKRQQLLTSDDKPTLRIFQADGRGTVRLAVEGLRLRAGQTVSSVVLEEELQLVPKCCDVSFGGAHGNVVYTADNDGASVCIPDGWGFVAGAALNDSGAITVNGNIDIVNTAGDAVDPLYCIASDPANCEFRAQASGYGLQTVQPVLAFEYIPKMDEALKTRAPGTISRLSDVSGLLFCTSTTGLPANPKLKDCPSNDVTLDATAATLPDFCTVHEEKELHCRLAELDYSGLDISVINTAGRPIRLFFTQDGAVLRSTGNGTLTHQPGDNRTATDFALLGCTECGTQTVTISGTPDGLGVFAWFPQGDITVTGGSAYEGVIWANQITTSGDVQWTISSSSVLSAMAMLGFALEGDQNPPSFDWVARSVRSFRWFGS